jgi:hypothetical protein
MGKILALVAVTLAGLGGFRMASISVDPDPPKAGKPCTITYTAGASLLIEWTPGGVERATCGTDGKATVNVPSSATAMLVMDANNSSVSAGYSVSP